MRYKSTRNSDINVSASEAIVKGLSDEGGLFVPENLPIIDESFIMTLCGKKSYEERAFEIFKLFLTDFSDKDIKDSVSNAYGENFNRDSESGGNPAPVSRLMPNAYILELWHGPTCAFKDMALQILPFLLTKSAKNIGCEKEIAILVATSGDTGKAALEGFKDISGTKIMVFYPENGVSEMQKRQMLTQKGSNVNVCAVKGNFDDCQSGVKKIFTDNEISAKLTSQNVLLSSANSINWGRLLPQIVYYICSYAELLSQGEIKCGEKLNIVVPTGNFGNILAAFYAKEMGIPIGKLICASNKNNILTDFIKTGVYDKNRDFFTTISPSMDILVSSNLERFLYYISNDDEAVKNWFGELNEKGKYEVNGSVKSKLSEIFYGGFCDDESTKKTIKAVFDEYSYLMDTHTAVAYKVYSDYNNQTGDNTKTLIVSTANPYKFVSSVNEAIEGVAKNSDEFEIARRLEKLTGTRMPAALAATEREAVRFNKSVDIEKMSAAVLEFLER